MDSGDARTKSPELDLDAMAETVQETLQTTEDLAKRLGELNKEMTDRVYNVAQTKFGGR